MRSMLRCTARLLLTACVAASATGASQAATAPVYREIKDWTVVCDNTASCEARGRYKGYPGLVVRLQSQAGPTGARSLSVEAGQPLQPTRLRLDGKPLDLAWSGWENTANSMGILSTDSAEAIRAFLARVRNGNRLQYVTDGEPLTGSLSGLNAALLLIDETQGRLDTITALIRHGERPASAVPPAPLPPMLPAAAKTPTPLDDAARARLIAAVRKAQSALLRKEACEEADPDHAFDEAEALNAREALVLLLCYRGAYQHSSLALRVPRAHPGQATLLRPPLPAQLASVYGANEMNMLTNASYDPGTAMLYHMAKGRGLADCGVSASWRFDGERFHLAEMHYFSACRGDAPGDWPSLWRTRDASAH